MGFPGEKLVIRLWETLTEKAIGSLLRPWQVRREGRAYIDVKREEILALAQAQKDATQISLGSKQFCYDKENKPYLSDIKSHSEISTNHSSSAGSSKSIIDHAQTIQIMETVRKEINVAKAILCAEEELANDVGDPPPTIIDNDWLIRWRDQASQTSSDELQTLWGRLLAGEVKAPGTYSLRTLDFMKNLSSSEAMSIAKLSRFVIAGIICRDAIEIMESEGIGFDYLLEMQQLGIIMGVESVGLTFTFNSSTPDSYTTVLTCHGRLILVRHKDVSKKVALTVFQVTKIGKQILTLGKFEPHEPYLRKICSVIKAKEFNVSIADYTNLPNGLLHYTNEEIVLT